ncbi:6400_t:CDS:2, partial [Dentiscutata heterogama]
FGNINEPELEISNTKESESGIIKESEPGIIKDSKSEFINVKEPNTKQWGKIELGRICYQVLSTSKADHYDLKADGAIAAFLAGIKNRKNIQLCVYQDNNKSRANKKIC